MPKITEMFAYIAEEAPGDEGIVGCQTASGWMPLVAADCRLAESLIPIAMRVSEATGKPVRLVKFTNLEEVWGVGK